MEAQQLLDHVRSEEAKGHLFAGEAIIVGLHEPAPVDGALRVGRLHGALNVVERFEAGVWSTTRSYDRVGDAYGHAFDVVGDLTAGRYWGEEFWGRRNRHVAEGCVLRISALLLDPRGDLLHDRSELIERLQQLGLTPEHRYWVEGVEEAGPQEDEILELRRADDGGWCIVFRERGVTRELARFAAERDACQWLFAELVSQAAVSMGRSGTAGEVEPYVVERFRELVAAALDEAAALVRARTGAP
jgi:hypothetical protein